MLKISDAQVYFSDDGSSFLTASNLEFPPGLNYLVGENGSGKSSFFCALSGMFEHVSVKGQVAYNGTKLTQKDVGLITQNVSESIVGEFTFAQNMLSFTSCGAKSLSLKMLASSNQRDALSKYIESIGLKELVEKVRDRPALQLSGGEKQLLAIAMRTYQGAKVLLLDEVTSNLDKPNTELVMRLICSLAEQETTIIFSTHQSEIISRYPGCVFKISNARIQAQKNTAVTA